MSSVAPFGCRAFRALKPDRDRFVLPLSQPDWATKSFSLFQSPQLGYWALSFKPVRDWFVLWSLSSQVGRLILSVKFSQLSCWLFPCIWPVRDWSVCSPSASKLDDKIFFFFSSHFSFGCWASVLSSQIATGLFAISQWPNWVTSLSFSCATYWWGTFKPQDGSLWRAGSGPFRYVDSSSLATL